MLQVLHVFGFVMMAVPLFNLIVVNERALMGSTFVYATDRYMENIIRHGARRCYVYQLTVLLTGVLLVSVGPLGLASLWTNWVLATKIALLLGLMGLLSYVHLGIQPKIEALLAPLDAGAPAPEGFAARLKPYRVVRKRLASVCLFLVLTTIIFGLQIYGTFHLALTAALIACAGLFAVRANRSLIRFGWV
jgi:hypothetical protein